MNNLLLTESPVKAETLPSSPGAGWVLNGEKEV